MAMTVQELIKKYRERFPSHGEAGLRPEHVKFIEDLLRVSGKRWKKDTYPADIDVATKLNDEEAFAWLKRMANLPGCQ